MSGALDGLAPLPERIARDDAPTADTRAPPSLGEQVAASFRTEADTSKAVQEDRLNRLYAPMIDALRERGVSDRELLADQGTYMSGGLQPGVRAVGYDYAKVFTRAQQVGLPNLAANQAEYEKQALRRYGGRDVDQDTQARGHGVGAFVAQTLGGMGGSLTDPYMAATLPLGGFGRSAATRIVTEGLAADAGVALSLPGRAHALERMGEDYSAGDAARDLALGFATGAAIRGGIEIAPKLDAAGYAAATPLREKFDQFFKDSDTARSLARGEVPIGATPEQAAAIHVLTREAAIDGASPYTPTIAGDALHRAKLQDAADRLDEASGPRRGPGKLDPEILNFWRGKGYSEGQARGITAGIMAESGGNPAARNPASGAFGLGQDLGPRQAELIRRFGPNPSKLQQLEFMHWELQGGDPGGKHVLAHGEEADVLRAYIEKFMRPAAGRETTGDLERGMAALGRHGELPAPGTDVAASLGGLSEADDVPAIRPEALDAVRPFVSSAGKEIPVAQFRPSDIDVDAGLMQFKSGADQLGVTDRLKGIEEWDPVAAGIVTVWQPNEGRPLIADGHQRLGLAKRVAAAGGEEPTLNAFVLREADGYSARDARIITALKNVGEGTGSAVDAAKVLREAGPEFERLVEKRLPPRSALVRDGKALARLSDEAFGAVVNDVIPESYGAAIGHLAPDPSTHLALVALLNKSEPANRRQAEAIVRQALDAGFTKLTQEELFGARDLTSSLFAVKAKILDRTLSELKRLKGAVSVAARNADALEGAGNRIDVAGSEAAAAGNAQALGLVERLALRKGNAVNEALDLAAQRAGSGEPLARVTRDLVAAIRSVELGDLEREGGSLAGGGERPGGSGRAELDQGQAREDAHALTDAERDALEETQDLGPSLFEDPASPASKAFDSDAGPGIEAAAESDWHDIRAAGATNAVTPPHIGAELEAKIERDPAAARAEYEAIDDRATGLTSEGGRVLNTDLARELSPEYRADRSRSAEVHEPASALVKRLYAEKLAEGPPAGRDKEVLFTAGGTGAGKSTGLQLLEGENAGIIYDTNMNGLASAVGKIEQALKAGWKVRILYTYRDPIEALVNGALPRAERMGRTVPLEAHVDTHVGAREVIADLAERYAGDDRVDIAAVDNSRGRGNAALVELENLPAVPKEGLHETAQAAVRDAHQRGAIGDRTLAGSLGHEALGAADRRQPEPADRGQVNPLDRGAAADPNIADLNRQRAALGAAGPLRAPVEQDGTGGLGLFEVADEPKFDLDDGKGARTAAEIEAEIAADKAGLEEIRKCLK